MSIVVQVWKCRSVRQSMRSSRCVRKARDVVDVQAGCVFLGDDEQVLGQRQLSLAEDGVGAGQQFLRPAFAGRRARSVRCRWPAATGWTPAASTAWTACTPGTTVGMIGPVSSWMMAPKLVSSCGGRPTTVNGQIASRSMIDVLDVQHREVVRQAVIAEMIAERALGQAADRDRRCR